VVMTNVAAPPTTDLSFNSSTTKKLVAARGGGGRKRCSRQDGGWGWGFRVCDIFSAWGLVAHLFQSSPSLNIPLLIKWWCCCPSVCPSSHQEANRKIYI